MTGTLKMANISKYCDKMFKIYFCPVKRNAMIFQKLIHLWDLEGKEGQIKFSHSTYVIMHSKSELILPGSVVNEAAY